MVRRTDPPHEPDRDSSHPQYGLGKAQEHERAPRGENFFDCLDGSDARPVGEKTHQARQGEEPDPDNEVDFHRTYSRNQRPVGLYDLSLSQHAG